MVFLYEVYDDFKYFTFVTEYMSGGDMLKYILREGPLPDSNAKMCIYKLIQAIRFCHSKKVLHNDICLENLLVGE